jgi:hypothetical protein
MENDKPRPAKASEHGASRKYDQVTTTEEEDKAPRDTYFNDDGNKTTDVEFVGVRAPDTDPDDRESIRDK